MKIVFVASERHFLDHLAPVWNMIPAEHRGRIYLPRTLDAHAHHVDVVQDARFYTEQNEAMSELRAMTNRGQQVLIVVSASGNVKFGNRTGNPVILMQHGAGQSYGSKSNPSYAGYAHHKGIAGFIHPGPHPARRDRMVYPGTPVFEVGSPRLDVYHEKMRKGITFPETPNEKPVVAIAFHWAAKIGVPEAGSQFDYYKSGFKDLANADEFTVIGHSHPRLWKAARRFYEKNGIEPVREFSEVMKRADLFAIDNSSTLFEFASTGRPALVLNGPSYRKTSNYGLRFWDAAHVGINVETPRNLYAKILEALEDSAKVREDREDALSKVYTYRDGKSSERAVNAILDVRKRLVTRTLKTKQLDVMALPKNVYMIARATFYNTQHEGQVRRGRGFWTTEPRARVLESPQHQLAYRADAPEGENPPEGPFSQKVSEEANRRKTKVDGPKITKTGPDPVKAPENLVDPNALEVEHGSGGASAEWTPSDEELEEAMKSRLGFGEARGSWIPVLIDGKEVHKSQGREAATKDGRELMKVVLIEEYYQG